MTIQASSALLCLWTSCKDNNRSSDRSSKFSINILDVRRDWGLKGNDRHPHRVAPRAIIIFIGDQIKYFGEVKTHEKNVFEKITHQSFETPARPFLRGKIPRPLNIKHDYGL